MGDDPTHLLVRCGHKEDSTILLLPEYPQLRVDFSTQKGAFLGLWRLLASEIVVHCAFAKTLWKARCIAYYTNIVPNPLLIVQLFKRLLCSVSIPTETPVLVPFVEAASIASFHLE